MSVQPSAWRDFDDKRPSPLRRSEIKYSFCVDERSIDGFVKKGIMSGFRHAKSIPKLQAIELLGFFGCFLGGGRAKRDV